MSVKTRRIVPRHDDDRDGKHWYFERACGRCAIYDGNAAANGLPSITLVCPRCVGVDETRPHIAQTKVYCARTPEEAYSRRVALELMK